MAAPQRVLIACLTFISLTSLADGAPMKLMSAPNLLWAGKAANVFVECQDCNGAAMTVNISVMNHPAKDKTLTATSVTLNATNNFQRFGQITIPAANISRDPNTKQYVYLKAQFPDRLLEKLVLVSVQSGHIFIQTDKTIYTPNSKVRFRIFAVTPSMEPVEWDGVQTDASVVVEIVTPDNMVLPLGPASLSSGIHSGDFQLGEIVSAGLWKVVAKFPSRPRQSYSAEFEVKEHVLPSFEVNLTPESSFYYMDSPELIINIRATYLFGEEVDGAAFAVFGVMDGHDKSFPGSFQRLMIEKGVGAVTLRREHITQTFPKIQDLVGKSIYVSVSVLSEIGGEMVKAELRGIQIVTSPYTISLKRTPRYFKPGMTFDVSVEVSNPDETPAQGVAVLVEPGAVRGITSANGIAKLQVKTGKSQKLSVTVKTEDPRVERQAEASMEAQAYFSQSQSYIHIDVGTNEVKLGDKLRITLSVSEQQNPDRNITYLILSRGQLVRFGRFKKQGNQQVRITRDLLPSFRIVAYYHPRNEEVVSDSVRVDVKVTCMGSLKLESSKPASSYEPHGTFSLKVTGDPGATVGLVAVDKGVYALNNKHRLTQKKVWDVLENFDTGCTPGGGQDSMGVFYDAGLLFESSTASGTPHRPELKCPSHIRRKRASSLDVTSSLLDQYRDGLQRSCCLDGMRVSPPLPSCERRSEDIVSGAACVQAFLRCCKDTENQRLDEREEKLHLPLSEEMVSRTSFPESWLWSDIKLPACPRETPECVSTSLVEKVQLKDSLTTWQVTGISLSRTQGICVGDPYEVVVHKDFFIDLRLPYSAVRGEQIEVKAILHNSSPDTVEVFVDLREQENVCSAASKRGKYHQEVVVGPWTSRSVPFIIIPMETGKFHMEVKAAVKGSSLSDAVRKMLRVVPKGVLVKSPQVIILDPTNKTECGTQEEIIISDIPKKDLVPNTPAYTLISVTGRDIMAPLVENVLSGRPLAGLNFHPQGCGDQGRVNTTLSIIATTYLDRTNQWDSVGAQRRDEALQHITTGYQNQLTFRRSDGSFFMWPELPGSTWLTAYIVKVFSMADRLVPVRRDVICDAVRFILHTQQADGRFKKVGSVHHGGKPGDGDKCGGDSDASMTSFCLVAVQESRPLCAAAVKDLPGRVDKAVAFLQSRLPNITNPYAVAVASYALANENKLNREILYKFAAEDSSHWPSAEGDGCTLEATAYALLALVKAKAFEDARPVARWFRQQQEVGRTYGSAQAAVLVNQAAAEYWASAEEPDYDLNVDVLLPGRSKPYQHKFSRENLYVTETLEFRDINQAVKVKATGTGAATFTMVSVFYAWPKEAEGDCEKFNLTVALHQEDEEHEGKAYKLKIEVLYEDEERDATMSILEIGLLTGFTPDTDDLDALTKGHSRIISKYQMNTHLSQRGSLLLYLDKVSHRQPEEISFRLHQKLKVGFLQPAAVSVYEYYDQRHCVKFYHPERKELPHLCRNDGCMCAEENCSVQKDKISNDQRQSKICESTRSSKTEFAYKVTLEEFEEDPFTDIYAMRIIQVIKEGSSDVNPQGQLRTFLSFPRCRKTLALEKGKTYLIMGTFSDIHEDKRNQSYQYLLGERSWIEYWPTEEECQADEHKPACVGIEEMKRFYQLFGCIL